MQNGRRSRGHNRPATEADTVCSACFNHRVLRMAILTEPALGISMRRGAQRGGRAGGKCMQTPSGTLGPRRAGYLAAGRVKSGVHP